MDYHIVLLSLEIMLPHHDNLYPESFLTLILVMDLLSSIHFGKTFTWENYGRDSSGFLINNLLYIFMQKHILWQQHIKTCSLFTISAIPRFCVEGLPQNFRFRSFCIDLVAN